ncbi:NUDIX domain-containing protein [Caldibacillus thermoamylovorans]
MRFGEELEAALIREIEEEVGLTVTVEKVLYAATRRNAIATNALWESKRRWGGHSLFMKTIHLPLNQIDDVT